MRQIKKMISIALAVLLAVTLSACGERKTENPLTAVSQKESSSSQAAVKPVPESVLKSTQSQFLL